MEFEQLWPAVTKYIVNEQVMVQQEEGAEGAVVNRG